MKISACLIVKNEEEFLAGCLQSIRGLVDEIIVVDTGSDDRSGDIARHFDARIYHHPWENDFSLHRNQSLSYATGDWILQIDADERLATPAEWVRQILQDIPADTAALDILIRDKMRSGQVKSVFVFPRLFRRSASPRYENRVHNQLRIEGKRAAADIVIDHFGYDLPPEKQREKSLRTRTLLLRELETNPGNSFIWLNLLYVEASLDNYRECIRIGERLLEQHTSTVCENPLYWPVYHVLFRAYIQANRRNNALAVLEHYENSIPATHLDLLHAKTQAAFLAESWTGVIELSKKYIQHREQYLSEPMRCAQDNVQTLNMNHEVCLWRSIAALNLRSPKTLRDAFTELCSEPLFSESQALQLLEYLPFMDDTFLSEVLRQCWGRFRSPEFILSSLRILSEHRSEIPEAQFLIDEIVPRIRERHAYSLAVLLMKLAQYRQAAEIFLKHKDDPLIGENALFFAAQCMLEQGEREEAKAVLEELLLKAPAHKEANILYETLFGVDKDGEVRQSQSSDAEREQVLVEAAEMAREMWEQEKQESAVLLLGEIHNVLSPEQEIIFQDISDITLQAGRLGDIAKNMKYHCLADALEQFRETVHADLIRWGSM